jgi:hypothetical protein
MRTLKGVSAINSNKKTGVGSDLPGFASHHTGRPKELFVFLAEHRLPEEPTGYKARAQTASHCRT